MARLAWETFPRSGSMWLAQCLSRSYPTHQIIHGEHRRANLGAYANQITSVRNPLDCVSSWMLFTNRTTDAEPLLEWYIRFYDRLADRKGLVFIATFEDLVSCPENVMQSYAQWFGLAKPRRLDIQALEKFMRVSFSDHMPRSSEGIRSTCKDLVVGSVSFANAVQSYENILP